MTKGRKFVPPPDREGIWFGHKGADNSDAGTLPTELTTTGQMLSALYRDTGRPAPPPRPYNARSQTIYRTANPFSSLDNRYTIQDCGEYFGDGRSSRFLGRRLLQPLHRRQHHTDRDHLMHHCRNPTLYSYNSEVSSNYVDNKNFGTTTTSSSHGTGATTHPPSGRRFPRRRPEPRLGPVRPLPTTTTDWSPDTPRSLGSLKASNRVLALSQRPFLKPTSWKYSYHGLPKVYPTYDPLPGKLPSTEYVFPNSWL